jgi:hypothetical protein
MDPGQDLKWKPSTLSLEQVQAVITYHREININFVISVYTLCMRKEKHTSKTFMPVLSKARHKIDGLLP